MTNDYLAGYWRRMHIIINEIGNDYSLKEFFNIQKCLGQHKNGVLFIVKDGQGEEDSLILKCNEEDYCYKKVADTGDDDQDWKEVGFLIEASGPDSMPPYT